jgi:hypothetical protein
MKQLQIGFKLWNYLFVGLTKYKIMAFSCFGKCGKFSNSGKYKMPKKQKMLRFARLADKTVLANTRHTCHALIRYLPNLPHLPNAFFKEKQHLPC